MIYKQKIGRVRKVKENMTKVLFLNKKRRRKEKDRKEKKKILILFFICNL